tara:strand:- start:547 stop:945 length:399 start_codon:yes stop_codon:yes gene_type:complete
METYLKKTVLVKSFLFLLIVFWGGYNSAMVNATSSSENFTDIGNMFFLIFSILYMLNAFFLIKLKTLGRLTFLPLVILFIFLGFISELLNPMQIKNDYFYLFIFYIVSPLFFVMQGSVLCMLMSKSGREAFH